MCRKSPDKEKIAIGEYQVKKAKQKLNELGQLDLEIDLFHHPLNWLWPEDRNINSNYFNKFSDYFSFRISSIFSLQGG